MNGTARRSILCPHCRKLISCDEPACPYCGLSRPGAWWKIRLFSIIAADGGSIVRLLIIANAAMYVISVVLSSSGIGLSAGPMRFLSPSNNILLLMGATGVIPIEQLGRWWSLISAGYLHGGLLHIFFNMAALAQLGQLVLQEYGLNRMIILYTVFNLSFSVWLLKGFLDEIPREYEEAAMVDGYTRLQAFIKIVLPQSLTGIAATTVFCLIFAWNEYAFALMLTADTARTAPPSIPSVLGTGGIEWAAIAAGSLGFLIPVVIVTFALRKYLLRGVTFGAIRQ